MRKLAILYENRKRLCKSLKKIGETKKRRNKICLHLKDESNPIICTDSFESGEPFRIGNETHFDIAPTVATNIELEWADLNDS